MSGDASITGSDIVAAVLLAFGISTTGIEFAGGLSLGIAGAIVASRILAAGMVKNAKSLGFWGSILTGVFVSIIAAMAAQWLAPGLPVQFPMAVGGFLSSFIAPFCLKLASRVTRRADDIADRTIDKVLPGDDP